jgi:hypothetical protein
MPCLIFVLGALIHPAGQLNKMFNAQSPENTIVKVPKVILPPIPTNRVKREEELWYKAYLGKRTLR